ncbi:phosphoesterase [Candidatus Francisella endociliophora]|uniref:undecaprenyl-diphosphate phosphatase n=1 Tax=Candidatus Francisella endociliophora TaxID=653937 RepID=A0A097EP98_9GAMM|nr:phosphatase PAP2 family protein [Francisella sp. FSC1006]AIT09388.1 phosphoesterase [Francisella sp. FSC1006]
MNCIDCKLVKNTTIFGILTLIIVTFSYNFIDIKVTSIIHTSDFFGTGISTLAVFFSKIFSPKIWAVITVIVTAICIFKYITKKTSPKLYTMSLTLIITFFISGTLKVLLARSRPELLLFDNQYGFHFFSFKSAYNSMPSGHTVFTFAGLLAVANFFEKKYITLIAIIIGCLVAASRVIILDHYVSDVIVSAYIGTFAYLWAKAFVESNNLTTKNE